MIAVELFFFKEAFFANTSSFWSGSRLVTSSDSSCFNTFFAKGQFDFLFTNGGANAGMMAPTKSRGHLGSPNLRSHKEVAGMWICMKKTMLQPESVVMKEVILLRSSCLML